MSQRGTTNRRPTQADVGRLAGVSSGVVSAVVNNRMDGSVRVGREAEARVRAAIAKLGYVPNMAARQLAGGRNDVIGVFTYSPIFPTAAEDFYYPMLQGIEEAAEHAGQNLLLFTGGPVSPEGTRMIYRDGVNSLQLADGSILLGRDSDSEEVRRLSADGYPFVYIGRHTEEHGDVSYVTANYAEATTAAVTRAVGLGHRQVAMIATDLWHPAMADRAEGFHAARAALGLDTAPVYSVPSTDPVDDLVASVIDQGVTCVFVADCLVARAAVAVATARGLRVPEDFSVVSLSDYPGGTDPELNRVTSVLTPTLDLGRVSVSLLVELLTADAREPVSRVVACGFRDGETLARVAA
ncbi:LacI family DNA-binding transcriptional regulator [Actinophytocola oryzae]|uniref:LacI family DNA-binding transcriptional regulator n=1 Tax=Actinophytocola oryzae TaxID=502181 RepID=UPI001414D778|nr:LacI family DNA-binding transcriptional regulator [Actinophytocola oryzae]